MEFKQAMTFLSALSFLGTMALLVTACVTVALSWTIGEHRLSRGVTASAQWVFNGRGLIGKVCAAALVLVSGYFLVLVGASFASHSRVLGPGEEKYFCEMDCHVAYSVAGVTQAKTIGSDPHVASAEGMFFVVTVRTRFDERTISPHRGDAPLMPGPRVITVVDEQGCKYLISPAGEEVLASSQGTGAPMTQPLRPGESYSTQLVFDLPAGARNPRLLIASPTQPSWIGLLLIGDEDSLFHKKVFFRLS